MGSLNQSALSRSPEQTRDGINPVSRLPEHQVGRGQSRLPGIPGPGLFSVGQFLQIGNEPLPPLRTMSPIKAVFF